MDSATMKCKNCQKELPINRFLRVSYYSKKTREKKSCLKRKCLGCLNDDNLRRYREKTTINRFRKIQNTNPEQVEEFVSEWIANNYDKTKEILQKIKEHNLELYFKSQKG